MNILLIIIIAIVSFIIGFISGSIAVLLVLLGKNSGVRIIRSDDDY